MSGLPAGSVRPLFFLGRLACVYAGMLVVMCCASAAYAVPTGEEDYDIIIEKNLFNDQRRKWEMEKPKSKGGSSQAGSTERQNIDQIKLFGTVIKDERSYAVMRVAPSPQELRRSPRVPRGRSRRAAISSPKTPETKRPYAVGDYIGGYKIAEIKSGSVLLEDPFDSNRYEIYMNDGRTERSAERTEVPEEKTATPPQPGGEPPGKGSRPPDKSKSPPRVSPKQSQAADFMRQRFERDMQIMRNDANDAVSRQVERDWERLQPMLPALDDKRREELLRLKEEFEKLRDR